MYVLEPSTGTSALTVLLKTICALTHCKALSLWMLIALKFTEVGFIPQTHHRQNQTKAAHGALIRCGNTLV